MMMMTRRKDLLFENIFNTVHYHKGQDEEERHKQDYTIKLLSRVSSFPKRTSERESFTEMFS